MKGFERTREMKMETTKYTKCTKMKGKWRRHVSCTLCISWLKNAMALAITGLAGAVSAVTGTSQEFRIDLRGMGPWEMRTARASEAISYSSAWATNALEDANAVVKVWPVKREKPKYIAIDLSGGTTATHYPIEYLDEIPGGSWSDEYKTSKLVLRHIPAGAFIMGGRATDYPGAVNTNLHMVTLTRDFYMGVFEVTQRQWELVMGNRPSWFTNEVYYAKRPVECVSFVDIRGGDKGVSWPNNSEVDEDSFMGVLRKKSGLTAFDLPTEAQWEYACRAGTTTALNNGKNTTGKYCANVNEVARYAGNCTFGETGQNDRNDGLDNATTIVGSYRPNDWGLFDMHGNVWEYCLDWERENHEGEIDPVGAREGTARMFRGQSWHQFGLFVTGTGGFSSGYRYVENWSQERKSTLVGFRLCLQGGELPELNDGTVLVNEAGEGMATWTPTKAGIYYLTHETQKNGVNGAELLGAWFEVAGPELTFEPDGELVPGVKIAINGAGEGWTVRYELGNGGQGAARPTSESPEYTGPITLNESAAIKAVALSNGGIESREFSATYSLMSVAGAVAKPRYPWNGKVDVDVTVKGDANLEYIVSLAALDLDGNTNLPVRTVVGRAVPSAPQSQANEFAFGGRGATALPPGTYRFTWDADADIAGDFDFANVAVKVSAEGSAIIAAKKVLPLEVVGYVGTETLTNVPVLVRLSTEINGFSYADFADASGGDLVFTDESESVVYPHEIDEWHTDGESLVWVKLPAMVNGTKFKMAYGNQKLETRNQKLATHEVWRDYAGVWHFNEDSGTAFDSTAHGLDALPNCGTNGTAATMAQMVAYENGACGRARVNSLKLPGRGNAWQNYMMVPAYDGLGIGGRFIISGFFNGEYWNDGTTWYPRLISRKSVNYNDQGWEVSYRDTYVSVSGDDGSEIRSDIPSLSQEWVQIVVAYDGLNCTCYTNGVYCGGMSLACGTSDNGVPLAFGNTATGSRWSFIGQYDEIRLRGGSLSADRIKADYDMIKNRNFVEYNRVEDGKGYAVSNSGEDPGASGAVVTLSAPANVLENSRQFECTDLVWDPVPGATGYEIWVSTTARGGLEGAVRVLTVTEPSFLDDDHTYAPPRYNIWIRAVDGKGNASEFTGPYEVGNFIS